VSQPSAPLDQTTGRDFDGHDRSLAKTNRFASGHDPL